ncbi:MAG: hypothetical protein ABFR82_15965 [Nitrospirota bacterium]
MKSFDIKAWLEDSAPTLLPSFTSCDPGRDYYLTHESQDASVVDNYTAILNMCLSAYEGSSVQHDDEMRNYHNFMSRSTFRPDNIRNEDYKSEMYGEWNVEDFILTGGIMHTICSLEEFERGLIRILCLYGSQPKVEDPSRKILHPNLKDFRRNSPEWEEAENSKRIYSISGRHAMLASYSINAEPDTEWNNRLWSIRTDRNTIARPVNTLRYPFQFFLQIHYDAYRAVQHLANEALTIQRISL